MAVDRVAEPQPRGWYLAREAGWLAGVSGDRVGQWARRGFIRSSQSTEVPRAYSFQDVAEAIVVHDLLDRGVSHADVRAAIGNLRTRYGDWPLSMAPLGTTVANPAKARLVLEEDSQRLDIGRGTGGQLLLIPHEDLRAVNEVLRRGGWVVRDRPDITHIEVNPDRLSGRPTVRGTRLAAARVGELAETPEGLRVLRTEYRLSKQEIDDAVEWFRAVRELEAA